MMGKKLAVALAGTTAILVGVGLVNVDRRPVKSTETVVEVIDGDTFYIQNRQRVRLLGLDAPELENCYGIEAKKALENIILHKQVLLKEPRVDIYRRIISLVYVDGKLINEYLIKNGFAYYRSAGTSELPNLKIANTYAQEHKLGIFGPNCFQQEPPDPKCPIKGNFDDNSDKKVYFLPSCSYYKPTVIMRFLGEQWFCSEAEAIKAGFEKSKYCK
jgi:endonuclease YncB( thermonuclease family)